MSQITQPIQARYHQTVITVVVVSCLLLGMITSQKAFEQSIFID